MATLVEVAQDLMAVYNHPVYLSGEADPCGSFWAYDCRREALSRLASLPKMQKSLVEKIKNVKHARLRRNARMTILDLQDTLGRLDEYEDRLNQDLDDLEGQDQEECFGRLEALWDEQDKGNMTVELCLRLVGSRR